MENMNGNSTLKDMPRPKDLIEHGMGTASHASDISGPVAEYVTAHGFEDTGLSVDYLMGSFKSYCLRCFKKSKN